MNLDCAVDNTRPVVLFQVSSSRALAGKISCLPDLEQIAQASEAHVDGLHKAICIARPTDLRPVSVLEPLEAEAQGRSPTPLDQSMRSRTRV